MHSKRDQNFSLGGRGFDFFRILVFPTCSQTVPYDIFSLFLKVPMCFPDVPNSTKNFAQILFGIDNSGDSLRTLNHQSYEEKGIQLGFELPTDWQCRVSLSQQISRISYFAKKITLVNYTSRPKERLPWRVHSEDYFLYFFGVGPIKRPVTQQGGKKNHFNLQRRQQTIRIISLPFFRLGKIEIFHMPNMCRKGKMACVPYGTKKKKNQKPKTKKKPFQKPARKFN